MFEREDDTERFFIPAHGPDDEALAAGFEWLRAYAQKRDLADAAVWVPQKRNAENLGRVLGSSAAKALMKGQKIKLGAVAVSLLTERTGPSRYREPVLAVWVDDRQLDKLDGLRAAAICAIPWSRVDIDGWKEAWNPINALTGEGAGADQPIGDPVLQTALKSLSMIVNVSTGISHPSDKASAVQLFQILRQGGIPFSPQEVKALAIRLGWDSDDARDLASVAERIRAGKVVRAPGRKMWRDGILDKWREDAQKLGD